MIAHCDPRTSELYQAICETLRPQDHVVVVHSALYGLGEMRADVDGVLGVLLNGLGSDRTLVMPTFNYDFCRGRAYSHHHTVSQVGVLTERFRMLPGVVRSPHPIYSFAALGPKAQVVCRHEGPTVWGAGTPFEAFLETDALYMMLGVTWERACTQFHRAEELVGVPYRYWKEFKGEADFGQGLRSYRTRMYVRKLEPKNRIDFSPIVRRMEQKGLATVRRLTRGTIRIARARDTDQIAQDVVRENPLALFVEMSHPALQNSGLADDTNRKGRQD